MHPPRFMAAGVSSPQGGPSQNPAYRTFRPFVFFQPSTPGAMQLPDDPILRELVPEFIVSWRADLSTTLPALVATQDSNELYRFGHTLKGSARQFGFAELADCGAEIMELARSTQWDALDQITQRISQYLADIEQLARTHNLPLPQNSATNM